MHLLKSLRAYFRPEPPKAHIVKKNSYHERAIYLLVRDGSVTLAQLGGNHPSKVLKRLRDASFVKPLGSPDGERWEVNKKTGCKYKVYNWTGKLPANWVKSDAYTGRERRSRKRGK
jgi:hypothetical protein